MSSIDIEQGSPAWIEIRLGRVTASRVADVVAKTKSGWSASRANYMAELLIERMTAAPAPRYVSPEMAWGTVHEAAAKSAYCFLTDADIIEVGFVPHPSIPMSGASPDGEVGEHGLIEVKCPLTATHIDALLGIPIHAKYITQMDWQMACTGRKWCDFVSYDPRLPGQMQLYVQRVERDDRRIIELEAAISEFLIELGRKEAELRARYINRSPEPTATEQQAATLLADVNERGISRCLASAKDTPFIMGG